jgi:hypothetical protein
MEEIAIFIKAKYAQSQNLIQFIQKFLNKAKTQSCDTLIALGDY